jgi:hypothetical protein
MCAVIDDVRNCVGQLGQTVSIGLRLKILHSAQGQELHRIRS